MLDFSLFLLGSRVLTEKLAGFLKIITVSYYGRIRFTVFVLFLLSFVPFSLLLCSICNFAGFLVFYPFKVIIVVFLFVEIHCVMRVGNICAAFYQTSSDLCLSNACLSSSRLWPTFRISLS
jgi:hypothetical protein